MTTTCPVVGLLLLAGAMLTAQKPEDFPLGPDHERHAGVPVGRVEHYTFDQSKVFPGTTRDYWVYVPAQYDAAKPTAIMIYQDGAGWISEKGRNRAPIVMDNLIQQGAMPPTIGIFIDPGVMPALHADQQQARYNRSYEYDNMTDAYARFLIDELLPEVAKKYNLTSDPNARGIGGASSGGIAAFTAAWQRPDYFRRVMTFIGSYTNLRGGDVYPGLIRKSEGKPIKIFQQDGTKDQNIYSGHWYLANTELQSALEFAGYDLKTVYGEGGQHNGIHSSSIFPDALKWLWAGYPAPIQKPFSKAPRRVIGEILDPASDWELLSQGHQFTEGPAVDKEGNVFFTDTRAAKIWKIDTAGKVTLFKEDSGRANGMMFGADGRLYACQPGKDRIVAISPDGTETVLTEGTKSNDLAVTSTGRVYYSDPPAKTVWLIDTDGKRRAVHTGLAYPNGVLLSPDQSLLFVADFLNRNLWSFQIQDDGSLVNGQPFYHLEVPDDTSESHADGLTVDTEGFLYVATTLGIQVCDQPGRVNAIINKPQPGPISNVVFGGPNLDYLYATAGDKVYRRHLKRKGINAWTVIKPPKPGL